MHLKDKRKIIQELEKNNYCYVLITCSELSEDGKMEVEMNYEGDAILASYLLQKAQVHIDKTGEDFDTINDRQDKVISLPGG